MSKELLFRLTAKDFVVQKFRAGGKGGQNQNKTSSGVRIIHPASGARGECRETRSQLENKKRAFMRLYATKEFQAWHKMETARQMLGLHHVEEAVEKAMRPENLRVEGKEGGRWKEL